MTLKNMALSLFMLSLTMGQWYVQREINRQAANSWLAATSVAACRGTENTEIGEYHKGVISVSCVDGESGTVDVNIEVDPVLAQWIKSTGVDDDEFWAIEVRQ